MTDYRHVKNTLAVLMNCEVSELDKYDSLIESICLSLSTKTKASVNETDIRIIYLAAAKCYYQLLLLNQSENLTSFKAGDISYTVSSAAVDGAKELYLQAVRDSADLIDNSAFILKAV